MSFRRGTEELTKLPLDRCVRSVIVISFCSLFSERSGAQAFAKPARSRRSALHFRVPAVSPKQFCYP